MRAWLNMIWTEIKLFIREPLALFFIVVFPLLLLLVFGGIYGNTPTEDFNGLGAVDVLVPGYIGLVIATSGLLSLPIALATYRESGALRRYQAAPISPLIVLVTHVIVNLLASLVGVALVIVAGRIIYDLQLPDFPVALGLVFILSSLAIYTFGFIIGGTVSSSRAAQAVGNVLLFPMLFLSGAALPQELLPDLMRGISRALPLTYIVDGLQEAWYGGGLDMLALTVLTGLLALGTLVAVRTFRWQT